LPAPLTVTPRVGRALGSGVSLEIGAGIPEARGMRVMKRALRDSGSCMVLVF